MKDRFEPYRPIYLMLGEHFQAVTHGLRRIAMAEEALVRSMRACSVCGRATPWHGGTGALPSWTLVRQRNNPMFGISRGIDLGWGRWNANDPEPELKSLGRDTRSVIVRPDIIGIWCEDCPNGKPRANPWWLRI